MPDFNLDLSAALEGAAEILAQAAKDSVPIGDTGNLQSSITTGDVIKSGRKYNITIGIDPMELSGDVNYAPFVHNGTGLFGPKKRKIKPKNKQALNIPGFGPRKSSKGQKPQPFFEEAIKIGGDKAVDEFLRILKERGI